MCKRRDSIEAVSSAADRLGEACEAELRSAHPSKIDPLRPARAGVSNALRKTFRELTATPMDMALQLKKLR